MDLTEGGIRVPCLLRWPRGMPRGGVSEQLAMTMDWMPSFLDAADVAPDSAYPLDGISLLPLLRDPSWRCERSLYWRMNHRQQRALRDGRWKYLQVDGHDYLFDVVRDPRERANQAQREPARLQAMRQAWLDWNDTMPPIPGDAAVTLVHGLADMPQR